MESSTCIFSLSKQKNGTVTYWSGKACMGNSEVMLSVNCLSDIHVVKSGVQLEGLVWRSGPRHASDLIPVEMVLRMGSG
jgi:hypothetical protein